MIRKIHFFSNMRWQNFSILVGIQILNKPIRRIPISIQESRLLWALHCEVPIRKSEKTRFPLYYPRICLEFCLKSYLFFIAEQQCMKGKNRKPDGNSLSGQVFAEKPIRWEIFSIQGPNYKSLENSKGGFRRNIPQS